MYRDMTPNPVRVIRALTKVMVGRVSFTSRELSDEAVVNLTEVRMILRLLGHLGLVRGTGNGKAAFWAIDQSPASLGFWRGRADADRDA